MASVADVVSGLESLVVDAKGSVEFERPRGAALVTARAFVSKGARRHLIGEQAAEIREMALDGLMDEIEATLAGVPDGVDFDTAIGGES